MTHLTKSLIDLRGFGLAAQRVAKLCLDHAERRFDVASLVVALHEPFRVVSEQVKHLFQMAGRPAQRPSRLLFALKGMQEWLLCQVGEKRVKHSR
ncbi:MAG: hypothetical protein ACR2H6_06130 [Pyrinomonadaceae bacterium]